MASLIASHGEKEKDAYHYQDWNAVNRLPPLLSASFYKASPSACITNSRYVVSM